MRYKYTILKNVDGKYWLWFDEKGTVIDGKYIPNLQPYHEIETHQKLRNGAEIWTEELTSIPESCQLRPMGEYSGAYVVKARLKNEAAYLETPPSTDNAQTGPVFNPSMGKRPGMGKE